MVPSLARLTNLTMMMIMILLLMMMMTLIVMITGTRRGLRPILYCLQLHHSTGVTPFLVFVIIILIMVRGNGNGYDGNTPFHWGYTFPGDLHHHNIITLILMMMMMIHHFTFVTPFLVMMVLVGMSMVVMMMTNGTCSILGQECHQISKVHPPPHQAPPRQS